MTGVDKTGHYLQDARQRAGEEGVDIEFVQDDMREFKIEEEFDLVINLFTSFGYFEGDFKLMERSIEKDWSWLNNRRIRITDEGVKEYNVSHWLYSTKELKDMLKDAGFSSVDVYGGFDGRDYDEEANRLVAVGKK